MPGVLPEGRPPADRRQWLVQPRGQAAQSSEPLGRGRLHSGHAGSRPVVSQLPSRRRDAALDTQAFASPWLGQIFQLPSIMSVSPRFKYRVPHS